MTKFTKRWLPVGLWLIVIFWFSNQPDLPGNKIDWLDFVLKKLAHILEFCILLLLTHRAYGRRYPDYAFLFSLAFAFSDEVHQVFIPGRGAHLSDVAIDALGIILGVFFILRRKKHNA